MHGSSSFGRHESTLHLNQFSNFSHTSQWQLCPTHRSRLCHIQLNLIISNSDNSNFRFTEVRLRSLPYTIIKGGKRASDLSKLDILKFWLYQACSAALLCPRRRLYRKYLSFIVSYEVRAKCDTRQQCQALHPAVAGCWWAISHTSGHSCCCSEVNIFPLSKPDEH